MSEDTPTRRALPARERAESFAKRRASSPVPTATPASEPRQKRKYTKRASLINGSTPVTGTSSRSTPFDGSLPSKAYNAKPLPTSEAKQPEKLSKREYQSIAESAVLAASLHRSRMQWLCEGVFKRYWTKPVKRKGVIEQPPGNPDAKSMSKVGNATMTIEPHVFDVTFYTVKDPSNVPPPYYRHPNQHTAKQTQPPSMPTAVLQQKEVSRPVANPAATPSKMVAPSKPITATPTISAPVKQEAAESQNGTSTNDPSKSSAALPKPPVAHPPTQSVAPAPSSGGTSKPSTDPVIQMLAARAATDSRLKDLMKVVALSQASVEQLREFQAHIDEFNNIIKQREAKKVEGDKTTASPAPVPASASSASAPVPSPAPAASHPSTYKAPPRPHPGTPGLLGGPTHIASPTYPAIYAPPRAEPFIKHIVVEFQSAPSAAQGPSTDRWLFPEYAVLDIKNGGMEMTASFFVLRKGEEISGQRESSDDGEEAANRKFKAGVEYYQPVTVLIKATQHRTIETIARAAKPLVDCQKYMKEVMETKTRAPQEYLTYQLLREKALVDTSSSHFVDSAVEMSNDEDDELRDVYEVRAWTGFQFRALRKCLKYKFHRTK